MVVKFSKNVSISSIDDIFWQTENESKKEDSLIFDMKNVTSTPKLLIIHLNIIPANQSDTTPNDQKIAQGNSLVRTAIVLRGTYDRI